MAFLLFRTISILAMVDFIDDLLYQNQPKNKENFTNQKPNKNNKIHEKNTEEKQSWVQTISRRTSFPIALQTSWSLKEDPSTDNKDNTEGFDEWKPSRRNYL